MVIEEDSASAWQRFEDLRNANTGQFGPTEPAAKPPVATGFEITKAMDVLPGTRAPEPATAAPKVTLNEVMVMTRRNNRACPLLPQWVEFHKQLPMPLVAGRTLVAPPPTDGAAWNGTSPMQKRLRLRDQIEWADRFGTLAAAFEFLSALPEEQWHHFSD